MQSNELTKFASMLDGLCDYYQRQPLAKITASIYWEGLSGYSLDQVKQAAMAHIADPAAGQYFPKVADLTRHILRVEMAGVPGPDEAWAICYPLTDERRTVVITDAMRDAWALAWPVLHSGDEVGARVAFKDAYKRLIQSSTTAPRWELQLGTCMESRAEAIRLAVDAGRLPVRALEVHQLPAPTKGIAGLLESAQSAVAAGEAESHIADAIAHLSAIKRLLVGPRQAAVEAEQPNQRELFTAHKAAELDRLREFIESRQQQTAVAA